MCVPHSLEMDPLWNTGFAASSADLIELIKLPVCVHPWPGQSFNQWFRIYAVILI